MIKLARKGEKEQQDRACTEHEEVESRLSGELLQAFLKPAWKRSRKGLEPVNVCFFSRLKEKHFVKFRINLCPSILQPGFKKLLGPVQVFVNSVSTQDTAIIFVTNLKSQI